MKVKENVEDLVDRFENKFKEMIAEVPHRHFNMDLVQQWLGDCLKNVKGQTKDAKDLRSALRHQSERLKKARELMDKAISSSTSNLDLED